MNKNISRDSSFRFASFGMTGDYKIHEREESGGKAAAFLSRTPSKQNVIPNEMRNLKYTFIPLLFLCFLQTLHDSAQAQNNFLHAQGTKIVDGSGNEVLLRGIGLGEYMLIEPYMWGINNPQNKKSDTQQAILSSFAQLTGWDNVNAFIDEYRKNYMTEADVQMLKEAGFNSIRLPMHYNLFIEENAADNTFREKGFEMVDNLLNWCKKYEVRLILDMHAVPGGQSTDKAISDQYSPGLWDGNANGTAAQYQPN